MRPKMIQAGKPVTGQHFIGRNAEIGLMTSLIELGQSIVLIAPRRFGKTSLVREVLRKLKSAGAYTAYVDIFACPAIGSLSAQITGAVLKNHKLDRAFMKSRKSALEMMKNIRLRAEIEQFEFMLGFAENRINEWGLLQDSIQFIDRFAGRHNRSIVCAFDEFGDIGKLDGEKMIKLFRSGIQNHENAVYIFSGSYESIMNSMFIRRNAPFFRFARIIHLGNIEKAEFLKYFRKTLDSFAIPHKNAYLDNILDFTGGHPYYSQLALQTIIIQFLLSGEVIGLEKIKESMLNAELGYLEKSWEDISSSRENMKVLLAVAGRGRDIYSALKGENINVYRGLSALISCGVITRVHSGLYRLTDPLFGYWLFRNFRGELV
jgi:hypothetical protein